MLSVTLWVTPFGFAEASQPPLLLAIEPSKSSNFGTGTKKFYSSRIYLSHCDYKIPANL